MCIRDRKWRESDRDGDTWRSVEREMEIHGEKWRGEEGDGWMWGLGVVGWVLSLIHISEPTRLDVI
eukprot:4227029-Prorocentrum_lima.AAC.1